MEPWISFVIVNYDTQLQLKACLQAILRHTTGNVQIVVVDNASEDGSVDMVCTEFPGVELVANPVNRGYAQAVNQGLARARAFYILILNSDVYLTESTLPALVELMQANPAIGFAAPLQVSPAGERILSVHQTPTLVREWMRNLCFTDIIRYRLLQRPLAGRIRRAQPVEWVMGAALLTTQNLLREVGGMDENLFMFGEEFDWQYRARMKGWQVWFVPAACVVHEKGASVNKAFQSRRLAQVVRSGYYLSAKHFGLGRLPLFVLAQLTGSTLRMAMSAPLCLFRIGDACFQCREHWEVIRASLDPSLFRWIFRTLRKAHARNA